MDIPSLLDVIQPNQTTIIDLVMTRIVREGVFRFTRNLSARRYLGDDPGGTTP